MGFHGDEVQRELGVGVDREEKYIIFTREAGVGVLFEAMGRP